MEPAEMDWLREAYRAGATYEDVEQWYQTHGIDRSFWGIKHTSNLYGLRDGNPKRDTMYWRGVIWRDLKKRKIVHLDDYSLSPRGKIEVKNAMRWIVRSRAGRLASHPPGKGLTTRQYKFIDRVILNEEYPSWIPWSPLASKLEPSRTS